MQYLWLHILGYISATFTILLFNVRFLFQVVILMIACFRRSFYGGSHGNIIFCAFAKSFYMSFPKTRPSISNESAACCFDLQGLGRPGEPRNPETHHLETRRVFSASKNILRATPFAAGSSWLLEGAI